jgi:hypothetical protein
MRGVAKSIDLHEGHMFHVRNILISFGVFWLSLWVAGVLGWWPLGKLNDGIVYGDGVLSALAMGMMSSMHRTLAAALAGALVTVVVASRKPALWALIVAALYIVAAPVRHHWGYPATSWDRFWQSVDLVFPAVACIAAAVLTAHLRAKRSLTPVVSGR